MKTKLVSFIIPVRNEEDSVKPLFLEIKETVKKLHLNFEVIFIDDGSIDQTYQKLLQIRRQDSHVKVIQLRGNFGKSIALQVGFDNSKGSIVFTLDGDLQDNPSEIPNFLNKLNEGYDLVSGWKKKRHDPSISKVIPSRIVNFLTRKLTGLPIHDTNCGYKAYRREVVENLNLYGELYRFIPVFAIKQNFRVGEIPVGHRARKFGKTKFGWGRGVKGILDLLTVVFLTGFVQRPGHFFGSVGLLFFSLGFMIGVYITYLRLTTGSIQYRQPLLFLGMLLMFIGIQLISTGLLAEMMISSKQKSNYSAFIKTIN